MIMSRYFLKNKTWEQRRMVIFSSPLPPAHRVVRSPLLAQKYCLSAEAHVRQELGSVAGHTDPLGYAHPLSAPTDPTWSSMQDQLEYSVYHTCRRPPQYRVSMGHSQCCQCYSLWAVLTTQLGILHPGHEVTPNSSWPRWAGPNLEQPS